MASRLSDESAAAMKRINFSPSPSSTYFAFPIVVSSDPFLSSSRSVRSRFGAETTQLHSSTSRRATYTRIIRADMRGTRAFIRVRQEIIDDTRPAGRRVLHRAARRGTEKHPAAIYYRRLSIIDAGCIAVKRDSPLPYNSAPESRFFNGLLARRNAPSRDIRRSRRVIK